MPTRQELIDEFNQAAAAATQASIKQMAGYAPWLHHRRPASYGMEHPLPKSERQRLPRNTPLYHAKQWAGVPRKPTWFSFDPEIGLGIYASTGVTFLRTFVTTKDLKLLYFHGQSAVLSTYGTLDSQTALLREHVFKEPGNEFTYNETARG
ncbi:MAG: hypothetical protein Q9211_005861 [Gyalolechia sp. 1 TL-2023]